MKFTQRIFVGFFTLGLTTSIFAGNMEKKVVTDPMKEAMEKAMKLGAPSDAHKVLEPLAGKWNAVVKGRMSPDEKFQESKGVAEHTLILGNRFLKEDFKGDWAGQPFEGMGTVGFDNIRGEYQSTWFDNFMTTTMMSTGNYDAASKTLKLGGNFSCPMTGEKNRWFRVEWKTIDNEKNIYTSYNMGPNGKEYLSMEIVYTRIK